MRVVNRAMAGPADEARDVGVGGVAGEDRVGVFGAWDAQRETVGGQLVGEVHVGEC